MNIVAALGEQCEKAYRTKGKLENVTTVISFPMWNAFLDELQYAHQLPHENGLTIHGTRTIVVPSPKMFSYSR